MRTTLLTLSVLALTACDGEPPATTNCGDLANGQTVCDGESGTVTCVDGDRIPRPCGTGLVCAEAGGAHCDCSGAADGVCPNGCATDPDCAACTPMCDGAECGSDGCGGTCGTCAEGSVCRDGACEVVSGTCTDTCGPDGDPGGWAGDGACDDGGPGSDFAVCALGTDCTDCGPRGDVDAGMMMSVDAGTRTDSGTSPADAGTDAGTPSCSLSCSGTHPYCVEGSERGECCVAPAAFEMTVGDDCGSECATDSTMFDEDAFDPSAIAPFAAGAFCTYDDFFDNLVVAWADGSSVSGTFGIPGWRVNDTGTAMIDDFSVSLNGVGSRADGTYENAGGSSSCTATWVGFAPSGCGSEENTFGLLVLYDCLATLPGGATLRFFGDVDCSGMEIPTSFPP